VRATEEQKDYRYQLTIDNAADFIRQHRKAKLNWTPVGAVQGWDPQSYADAARQYVKMGYQYIALGGLVRSSTKAILEVLAAVHQVVPPEVQIHLFGIARLGAMVEFSRLGVRSVDSASYLRQAWMRVAQSYQSISGPYAALRIPEAGKSYRAKHMRDHAGLSEVEIAAMERRALDAVRMYDRGECSVDVCLEALLVYDRYVTKERTDMEPLYRRTLEDQPWKHCGCPICRAAGVDVIVFRGNNRNRRRGFHNTFVFYEILQRILSGEKVEGVKMVASPDAGQLQLCGLLGGR